MDPLLQFNEQSAKFFQALEPILTIFHKHSQTQLSLSEFQEMFLQAVDMYIDSHKHVDKHVHKQVDKVEVVKKENIIEKKSQSKKEAKVESKVTSSIPSTPSIPCVTPVSVSGEKKKIIKKKV